MNQVNKRVIDLPQEEMMQFFTLYNEYKNAEKQEKRAKASWVFLQFVYKHLGDEMLTYFTNEMYVSEMAETVKVMVRASLLLQPHFTSPRELKMERLNRDALLPSL